MLKHVLLKCWCAIIILIFSLRYSKCAAGFIQKLPHKTTLAALMPTRNRSIGAAAFVQHLPHKQTQSHMILTMPRGLPKTRPRLPPNLEGSHSETTRNHEQHEIPKDLKQEGAAGYIQRLPHKSTGLTWTPILPIRPSETGAPRLPPNLGGSHLETTGNHGGYEIAEGPKEQGTLGFKPKTLPSKIRNFPWPISPPWGFGKNTTPKHIPNIGISNLGTASQHEQQYIAPEDLVQPRFSGFEPKRVPHKINILPWTPWGPWRPMRPKHRPNFGISNLGTASQHEQYAAPEDLEEPDDWQAVPGAMHLAGSHYPSKSRPNHKPAKSRLSKMEYFTGNDALKVKFKMWPDGVVPYYIDALSYSDKVLRDRIRSFLNVVNSLTPLRFTELPIPPKNDTTRWVFFINRRGLLGCADHSIKNFTNKGVQQVILGYECVNAGGELAEAVLAIAGVPPQHNAPNRDNYIKVIENNILPEKQYLFQKLSSNEWVFNDMKSQNEEYDFLSAGHYHHHRYSANGRATIELRENYSEQIGDTRKLSDGDIQKLNWLYGYTVTPLQYRSQLPTCNKLFIRDPKFIQPQMKELMENEGLPEKTNDAITELGESPSPTKTEEEISDNEEDNDDNEEDNGDDEDDNGDDEDDINEDGGEKLVGNDYVSSPERPERFTRPSGVQLLKKQDKLSNSDDPLSYLSDYRTGDERYAKKLHKNVGVQYMQFGKSAKRRN